MDGKCGTTGQSLLLQHYSRACIGEGIKADVHHRICGQMVCISCQERQQVHPARVNAFHCNEIKEVGLGEGKVRSRLQSHTEDWLDVNDGMIPWIGVNDAMIPASSSLALPAVYLGCLTGKGLVF